MPIKDYYIVPKALTAVILLIFFINILFPLSGFIFWFFAGFFMLLVLFPVFVALTFLHLSTLFSNRKVKGENLKKVNILPWVTVIICISLTLVIERFHINDPFFNDNYQVEVKLFPDGSCSISFDGEQVGTRSTHRYDWLGSEVGDVWCRDKDSKSTTMIKFEGVVGVYPIYDMQGDIGKNGGAFFNDDLGSQLSPSFLASVYWEFVDGEIKVLAIEPSDVTDKPVYLRSPKLSVTVKAVGKRVFRGP